MAKISGPLLGRIDIHIDVPAVNYKEMRTEPESSAKSRERWARRSDPAGSWRGPVGARNPQKDRRKCGCAGVTGIEPKHIAEAIQYTGIGLFGLDRGRSS